jgi:outer membrane scaffolding protein for murein synthesis (MipA/OmpV family)
MAPEQIILGSNCGGESRAPSRVARPQRETVMKFQLYIACTATAAFICTGSASAQLLNTTTPATVPTVDDKSEKTFGGMVAIGAAVTPSYDGSSKYDPGPFAIANIKYRGIELKAVGTSLAINVAGDSPFEFGPIVSYSGGRDAKDMKGSFKLLDKIDSSLELGGYAAYKFGGDDNGEGRIQLSLKGTKAIKSGYGFSIEPSISYAALRREKVFASFDLGAKYTDSKAMRTTFGITPIEAERSGLAAFRPKGGISEVAAGVTAGYQFSKRWGLICRAQGGTYVGDASDSPIVKDGSKKFGLFAMGVSYSF